MDKDLWRCNKSSSDLRKFKDFKRAQSLLSEFVVSQTTFSRLKPSKRFFTHVTNFKTVKIIKLPGVLSSKKPSLGSFPKKVLSTETLLEDSRNSEVLEIPKLKAFFIRLA